MDDSWQVADDGLCHPPSLIHHPSSAIHHPQTTIPPMITGAHVLFYSTDADADRAFLQNVLQLRSVDAGHGWLIFAMPPTEAAVHPTSTPFLQEQGSAKLLGSVLYLMCDDLTTTIADLVARGAQVSTPEEARWGRFTSLQLPSGAALGLYQPGHKTAIS